MIPPACLMIAIPRSDDTPMNDMPGRGESTVSVSESLLDVLAALAVPVRFAVIVLSELEPSFVTKVPLAEGSVYVGVVPVVVFPRSNFAFLLESAAF